MIVSLMANSIFIATTLANEPSAEDILKIKQMFLGVEECINLEGDDKDYLVIIREEPLSLKDDDSDPDYKTRICYRNTFVYWADTDYKKKYTLDALIRGKDGDSGCSAAAIEAEEDFGATNFKARFSCSPVQVTLSKGGTSQIEGFINEIYTFAAGIVGIIAVAVIIISGIQISLGGGDTEATTGAKDRIIKSLTGIAILFLSGLILYTINPTFFVK